MSYWVYLNNDAGQPVTVAPFQEGGTQQVGGTDVAELNVTYNYSRVFASYDWAVRDLHGRSAQDTLEELTNLAEQLPNQPDRDYWRPTPGNAGAVVHRLLAWARQHPNAMWHIS